jgi:hypothetical protein
MIRFNLGVGLDPRPLDPEAGYLRSHRPRRRSDPHWEYRTRDNRPTQTSNKALDSESHQRTQHVHFMVHVGQTASRCSCCNPRGSEVPAMKHQQLTPSTAERDSLKAGRRIRNRAVPRQAARHCLLHGRTVSIANIKWSPSMVRAPALVLE